MKISLGRLLLVFSVGISALPMLAMAALILMMNSDIRTIAESEFDKISLQSARRLAEDTVRICAIIQNSREAANDNERKLIASVIYNRLAIGMPLGIDASILYIHQEHEGAPTGEMLAEESPYNTRLNVGLPPTPIANPGLASIQAVLAPETTNYYYYALDTATGQHRFFTNSGEFDAFVATQNYE